MDGDPQIKPIIDRRNALRWLWNGVKACGGIALLGACSGGRQDQRIGDEHGVDAMPSPPGEAPRQQGEFEAEPSWEQDFSQMPNGTPDPSMWRYELNPEVPGYNNEAQAYTRDTKNVRIEDGKLVIEAHKESHQYANGGKTYEYTSGRIDTMDSLNFEYGKVEVTMKLPEGPGTWPAFWFLSANEVHTRGLGLSTEDWEQPRTYMKNGELDGVEGYGHSPGMIEATVHTFTEFPEDRNTRRITVPDASNKFHVFGVELTPSKVTWTVDGKPYFSFDKISDNPDD